MGEGVVTSMEPYDHVLEARRKGRPTSQQFIANLTEDFLEFHGDRRFGDDNAIIAGIARIHDLPVTVIGIEKGNGLQDSNQAQFWSSSSGRIPQSAAPDETGRKFHRPVLCIVDTSGAYCGLGAENGDKGRPLPRT